MGLAAVSVDAATGGTADSFIVASLRSGERKTKVWDALFAAH